MISHIYTLNNSIEAINEDIKTISNIIFNNVNNKQCIFLNCDYFLNTIYLSINSINIFTSDNIIEYNDINSIDMSNEGFDIDLMLPSNTLTIDVIISELYKIFENIITDKKNIISKLDKLNMFSFNTDIYNNFLNMYILSDETETLLNVLLLHKNLKNPNIKNELFKTHINSNYNTFDYAYDVKEYCFDDMKKINDNNLIHFFRTLSDNYGFFEMKTKNIIFKNIISKMKSFFGYKRFSKTTFKKISNLDKILKYYNIRFECVYYQYSEKTIN